MTPGSSNSFGMSVQVRHIANNSGSAQKQQTVQRYKKTLEELDLFYHPLL